MEKYIRGPIQGSSSRASRYEYRDSAADTPYRRSARHHEEPRAASDYEFTEVASSLPTTHRSHSRDYLNSQAFSSISVRGDKDMERYGPRHSRQPIEYTRSEQPKPDTFRQGYTERNPTRPSRAGSMYGNRGPAMEIHIPLNSHGTLNPHHQGPKTTSRNESLDMDRHSSPQYYHQSTSSRHSQICGVTCRSGVPDMEMPLPLLTANVDQKWEICQEAANVLNGITAEMAVVAIVGKYRTGKSYLMNRLAGGNSGFGLGATIQSETKGIWMWAKPHPQNPSKCLLLLDTEGLYDVEKGDETNDMQLFTFALLLSNCLVYNAVGNIDNTLVDELELVSELSKNIQVKKASRKEDTENDFASYFPALFVVLRDFFLELELNGETITSGEYLENSLKLKPINPGSSARIQKYNAEFNAPRECISKYFPKRKCFTLPRPVRDDAYLRDLDMRPETDLKPDFVEKCKHAVESIIDHAKSMCTDGNIINGPGFLHLVSAYVRAINEGGVPCIESALDVMVEKECRKAYETAMAHYNKKMMHDIGIHMPVALENLHTKHEVYQKEAVEVYRKTSVFDERFTVYATKLENDIGKVFLNFKERNEKYSRHLSEEALQIFFADHEEFIKGGVFAMPGGHEDFKKMQQLAIDEYNMCETLGSQKQKVLHEYLVSKETAEKVIINADIMLTQKAKEEHAIQRMLRKQEEQIRQIAENTKQLQLETKRQQQDHEHMIKQMRREFHAKNERLRKEHDEKIERQKLQYERLMKEGLEQQAAQLRATMDEMNSEREEQERQEEQHHRQLARLQREMVNMTENQRRMQEQQERERENMKREMERTRAKGEAERRRLEERRLENERRYRRDQERLSRQCEQARAAAESEKNDSSCVVM